MASSSSRTPKLVSADPKNVGEEPPLKKVPSSKSAPTSSSSETSSWASVHASPSSARARSGATISSGASVAPRAVRVKRTNRPVLRSMTPRKSPAMPTAR